MELDSHHLSHEEFFSRLTSLFASHRTHERDSIYLTQKRLSLQTAAAAAASSSPSQSSEPDALADLHVQQALPVLVRATNGKSQHAPVQKGAKLSKGRLATGKNKKEGKVKLSTIVQPEELDAFFARYAECAKTGMSAGLKKRDRRANRRKRDKKKDKTAPAA